jgi:hypothetical protein
MSDSKLEKDTLRFITLFRELSPEYQEVVSALINYTHTLSLSLSTLLGGLTVSLGGTT